MASRLLMKAITSLAKRQGFVLQARNQIPGDVTPEERAIIEACQPYTGTSVHRILALIEATRYVVKNDVPGAMVECGVWRGGSMMVVAHTLKALGRVDRELYLYDTFEGMPDPGVQDRKFDDVAAAKLLAETPKNTGVWCYAQLDEVKRNMASTGYPAERIRYVQGKVEDTVPGVCPDTIALLRLDTDWYASTRHELEQMYPRLTKSGVLIIDDYGYWKGSRQATDEYFASRTRPLLTRIDNTGRIAIKI